MKTLYSLQTIEKPTLLIFPNLFAIFLTEILNMPYLNFKLHKILTKLGPILLTYFLHCFKIALKIPRYS